MSESRKTERAERLAERREDRAQRKSGTSDKGPGRNVWLAAIGAVVIAVVAIGVFTVGFGDQETTTTASAGNAVNSSNVDDRFPIVAYQGAPEVGARELDFTELLGTGRPVVLNFWAGQCPPCRAEMPAFQRVYDTYGDDFLLLGVDIGPFIGLGSTQSAIDLLAELEITYPAYRAVDGRAIEDYSVLSMPTTVFYDGDGVLVNSQSGMMTEESFEAGVREVIGLSA